MINNEVIWITGATSGIGKALVEQLAPNNTVIVSGRNTQALCMLKEQYPTLLLMPCDLVEISASQLQQHLASYSLHLDRIILSAGDCQYFEIDQGNWDIFEDVMRINFIATIKCIRAALPLLKHARAGHIVAITSLATAAAFPKAEAYGASKAALSYFLSSLRMDLAQSNITVTDVMPGFIDTPLTQKNTFDMPFLMSSQEAAKRIVLNIEKRPLTFVFPKRLSILFKLLQSFPKLWMSINARS